MANTCPLNKSVHWFGQQTITQCENSNIIIVYYPAEYL